MRVNDLIAAIETLVGLIAAIETLVGGTVRRPYLPGRPFDVPVNVLDISLAATHLGWQPRCLFQDGLRRTLEWQLSHGLYKHGARLPHEPVISR